MKTLVDLKIYTKLMEQLMYTGLDLKERQKMAVSHVFNRALLTASSYLLFEPEPRG